MPKQFNILILEDDYGRIDEFKNRFREFNDKYNIESIITHTEYANKCVELLSSDTVYDLVLLDHDLGGDVYVDINYKNTGSEVARFVNTSDKNFSNTQFICHSLNVVGSENICQLIKGCIKCPGLWDIITFHKVIQYRGI